jgi:signal transduction histidine kinase
VVFIVEDDGPGCAESELNLLTRRGFRADESKPGSGLGLAIVYDIVSSYGANLTFGRSAALGGLRVEVRFNT